VRRQRDRGFALLIVLWSLVLVSLILSQVLASGRSATALAQTGRDTAMGRAAADGAIAAAVFHLLNHDSGWSADGATQVLTIGASAVTVEVRNLAARINPNLASTALLAGLFQAAGLATQQSTTLARAVTTWRSAPATGTEAAGRVADYRRAGLAFAPPGRPFQDISELGDVMGMTPAVLVAITPALSLYQSGDPDPAIAPPMVREALKRAGQTGALSGQFDGNFPVVAIEADARGPGRSLVRREAVVSLPGDQAKTPYRILALTDAQ